MKRIYIFGMFLSILILACGGVSTPQIISTRTPEPTIAPPPVGKLGDTVSHDGYIITFVNVETGKVADQNGNILISVEMVIESGDPKGIRANPSYFKIKDANNYEYDTVPGKKPDMAFQNKLPLGEKMRGWVTFEIPETATGLILSYEPFRMTDNHIRIRFDLGR